MEESLDFTIVLLGLNKGMNFVKSPKFCYYSDDEVQRKQVLSESPDTVQNICWQLSTWIRLNVGNDNCIEQFMSLLHQQNTIIFVLFNGLDEKSDSL